MERKKIFGIDAYIDEEGNVFTPEGLPIKAFKQGTGYMAITVKRRKYLLHRVVLEAFKGHSKQQARHMDGNKANNALSNLEYCKRPPWKGRDYMSTINRIKDIHGERLTAQVKSFVTDTDFSDADIARIIKCPEEYVKNIRKKLDK